VGCSDEGGRSKCHKIGKQLVPHPSALVSSQAIVKEVDMTGRSLGPEDIFALVKKLEVIRNKAVDDKEAAIRMYPALDARTDARITALTKLINAFNSTQLLLTFVSNHLLHKSWWRTISRWPISDAALAVYVNEFDSFVRIGNVQLLFSTVESSFRVFLRALDATACNGGMAAFKSVYDCLLRSKLSAYPPGSVQLLDLVRLVRNTIHNNGVYFHRCGLDAAVEWRGMRYEFRQERRVDFVTWDFIMEISDAVRVLLRSVVEDARLRAITSEIIDPFASDT
jgi:hypothetical protein